MLYKAIVEDGPDLFSLHSPTADAPFRLVAFAQGSLTLMTGYDAICSTCVNLPCISQKLDFNV